MKVYGQFCPLAQATQLLCERWTLLIVRELIAGSTRFSELQRGVPLMSPTLLSARLKHLVEAKVITRVGDKGSYSYNLTDAGLELRPVVELLGAWGHRWARTNLGNQDLDVGLLMWDMRRSVDPAAFPIHRVVVQFTYPNARKGTRDWWLVSENGEVDLCLNDPGHEIDVTIRCSLRTMTAVWTCQLGFNDAVKSRDIEMLGPSKLTGRVQDWLCSSSLSKLGMVEELPELNWHSP